MSTSVAVVFELAVLGTIGFFLARNIVALSRRAALKKVQVRIDRFRR
jgi:hypothetical protein